MKQLLLLAVLATLALAGQKRYDGYQVYEVKAKDKLSFEVLIQLYHESSNYDFWTEPRGLDRSIQIMVAPAHQQTFVEIMQAFNIEYSIKFSNVQSLIDEGRKDINPASLLPKVHRGNSREARYSLNWTSYSDYPAILEFINELVTKYPNLISSTKIGTTVQGNDILMVKISTGGSNKKSIVADAGIHAREWISPAFMSWLIHELVENYAAHPQYVDNLDWYLIPVLNPDGYRYTFAANGDRLWRKNRNPNAGSPCIGTDLNRNYGYFWNTGGSSALPCSDVYHGGAPWSQLESVAARDAILAITNGEVYVAMHSYSEDMLYPWGMTYDPAPNNAELDALGQAFVKAVKAVEGTPYISAQSSSGLYIASGCTDDWAMSTRAEGGPGIPYSYTLEMRPGPNGASGFQLPANQILPNNLELWEGFKVIADFVITGKLP